MPSSATTPRCAARCIARKLPYALGVSSDLKVFLGTPALEAPPPLTGKGRPRTRRRLPPDTHTVEARAWAATQPAAPVATRLVAQRHEPRVARPLLRRPGHARARLARARRLAPEVWLLCERELAGGDRARYYLVRSARHRVAARLVQLAHQRWAIEQQYQELKDETRPRSFRRAQPAGLATARRVDRDRLQLSPARTPATRADHLTLPRVRAVIQEVLTAHFFMTQPALFQVDAQAQRSRTANLTK